MSDYPTSYTPPSPGEVINTPYVALKTYTDNQGNTHEGIYNNLNFSLGGVTLKDDIVNLFNNFLQVLQNIISTQRAKEIAFFENFIDKLGNTPLGIKLNNALGQAKSKSGQQGSFSVLLTMCETYLTGISTAQDDLVSFLEDYMIIKDLASNSTIRNALFQTIGRKAGLAANASMSPENYTDFDINMSPIHFIDKFINNLEQSIKQNLEEQGKSELYNKYQKYFTDFYNRIQPLAEHLLIEFLYKDNNNLDSFLESPRIQKEIKASGDSQYSIQKVVTNWITGVMAGKAGENTGAGFNTGAAKDIIWIETSTEKRVGSALDTKFDLIQPITANLEVSLDFIEKASEQWAEEIIEDQKIQKSYLDMKKINNLTEFEFNNLFYLRGSAKEYSGSSAKLVDPTKLGSMKRIEDIKALGSQPGVNTLDIQHLIFLMANAMPNAVAENETKNIENILGTIVSNWIVHEYGELMSEEMGNIHAPNLGNKLDFFSANGLYYTLSDMMQLVYNQLSNPYEKKRLVKLGIKWQTQDFSKNIPDNLAGIDRWNYLVNTSLSNIKFGEIDINYTQLEKAYINLKMLSNL